MITYKDKFDHFMYWFFGTTLLLQFITDQGLVFLIAFMLAIGKEIYDGSRNSVAEHYLDAAAGSAGAVVAILMVNI